MNAFGKPLTGRRVLVVAGVFAALAFAVASTRAGPARPNADAVKKLALAIPHARTPPTGDAGAGLRFTEWTLTSALRP